VVLLVWSFGPAKVYIAGGLHHALSQHHSLAALPVPALGQVFFKH
jgi:hypothetical protein